jgi:hypothetical protein
VNNLNAKNFQCVLRPSFDFFKLGVAAQSRELDPQNPEGATKGVYES